MNPVWMDRMGGVASATCALHCVTLAAAPALVSLLGVEFLRHEAFEWGFFALAIGFAVVAAVLGYRVHRTPWVLGGFALGIAILAAGRFGEALDLFEGSVVLAVIGGGVLIASHVASVRAHAACCE